MTHVSSASKVIELQTMLPSPSFACLTIMCLSCLSLLTESLRPQLQGFSGSEKKALAAFAVSGQGTSYGHSQLCVLRRLTRATRDTILCQAAGASPCRQRGAGGEMARRALHTPGPASVIPASSAQPPGPGLPVRTHRFKSRLPPKRKNTFKIPNGLRSLHSTAPHFYSLRGRKSSLSPPGFMALSAQKNWTPEPPILPPPPRATGQRGLQPTPTCHFSFREGCIVTATARGRGVSLDPPPGFLPRLTTSGQGTMYSFMCS